MVSRYPATGKKSFLGPKAADGRIFLFKDGVCLFCHRPKPSLCFRQSTAGLYLSRSSKSGCLMYSGRWSFDHISSEMLSFLLINNCFTLNTQDKPLLHQLSNPNLLPAPLSFNQYFLFTVFTVCLLSFSHLSSSLSSNLKQTLSFFFLGIRLTGRQKESKE